jgi:hypothetical protein
MVDKEMKKIIDSFFLLLLLFKMNINKRIKQYSTKTYFLVKYAKLIAIMSPAYSNNEIWRTLSLINVIKCTPKVYIKYINVTLQLIDYQIRVTLSLINVTAAIHASRGMVTLMGVVTLSPIKYPYKYTNNN